MPTLPYQPPPPSLHPQIPGGTTPSGPGGNVSGSPTTPSPPSSTTSPGSTGREIEFIPGTGSRKKPSPGQIILTGVAFAVNPLATVVGGILGSAFKEKNPYQGQPIAVIDGEVIFNPDHVRGPSGRGVDVFKNDAKLNGEKLQRTLDTGIVQPGISWYYQDFAKALSTLHNRPGPPNVRTPIINPPGHDEERPEDFGPVPGSGVEFLFGGNQLTPIGVEDFFVPKFVRSIPGGLAGFAQQTPAGQRQMFGGSSTGSTRKRRKSAAANGGKRSRKRRATRSRRKPKPGTKAWMSYIRGLRKK